jgi:shikimate kinase
MRVIVLTGFMGTGKSTVGRVLAERLDATFVDTDAMIEQRHGPIPTIFDEQGEAAFRSMERELARELTAPSITDSSTVVVSTGGGMLLDDEVAAVFDRADHVRVVCLVAEPEEILRRVTAEGPPDDRPLLAGHDPAVRIAELLAARADGYGRFTQVPTGGHTPTEVADAVLSAVEAL